MRMLLRLTRQNHVQRLAIRDLQRHLVRTQGWHREVAATLQARQAELDLERQRHDDTRMALATLMEAVDHLPADQRVSHGGAGVRMDSSGFWTPAVHLHDQPLARAMAAAKRTLG